MTEIKVLHINTMDSYGGAAQVANDLIASTHTVNRFAVKYKLTDRKDVLALSLHNIADFAFLFVDKLRSFRGIRSSIRIKLGMGESHNGTYSKLKKIKAYRDADIIHLHNIHGGFFDLNALPKIAREKKIVWTLHDMWIMTGGEAYTFDNENYKIGIAQTPFISYYPLSNPFFDRRTHYLNKKKRILNSIQSSLTVVPVSYWLEKSFRQSYVFNDRIHVQTIHNGIRLDIFSNKKQRSWKKPRILFFNSDNPFKGSYLFTNIVEKIESEFDLIVVGDKVKSIVPFRHYHFIESRSQLAEIYNQTDIMVFPSLAENLALTVMEAMACGVCVVASDTGGIPEILDNQAGHLFKSGDPNDLQAKIQTALRDLGATRELGAKAVRVVHEKFDLHQCTEQYEKLYRDVLADAVPHQPLTSQRP